MQSFVELDYISRTFERRVEVTVLRRTFRRTSRGSIYVQQYSFVSITVLPAACSCATGQIIDRLGSKIDMVYKLWMCAASLGCFPRFWSSAALFFLCSGFIFTNPGTTPLVQHWSLFPTAFLFSWVEIAITSVRQELGVCLIQIEPFFLPVDIQ